MKRIISLLLLLPLLALTACRHEPPTVESNFNVSFTVNQDGADYAGTLCREDGTLSISMSAPYTVQGMGFHYQDGELNVSYANHSTNAGCDYLPDNSIPEVLFDTLTYLPQAVCTGTADGEDSFTLPTPYGDAVLTARNGIPSSLDDPHSGLNFVFQAA